MTQADKVFATLDKQGYINNLQAFKMYILRLGAVIYDMKCLGFKIEGCYGKHISNLSPKMRDKYKKVYFYFRQDNIKKDNNGEITLKKFI